MVIKALGGRIRAREGSRLAITEYQDVDKSRRLVLVRRDNVEHLILLGGGQDLVIETGIGGTKGVTQQAESELPRNFAPAAGFQQPLPQKSVEPVATRPETTARPIAGRSETATSLAAAATPDRRPPSPGPTITAAPRPIPRPAPVPLTAGAPTAERAFSFSLDEDEMIEAPQPRRKPGPAEPPSMREPLFPPSEPPAFIGRPEPIQPPRQFATATPARIEDDAFLNENENENQNENENENEFRGVDIEDHREQDPPSQELQDDLQRQQPSERRPQFNEPQLRGEPQLRNDSQPRSEPQLRSEPQFRSDLHARSEAPIREPQARTEAQLRREPPRPVRAEVPRPDFRRTETPRPLPPRPEQRFAGPIRGDAAPYEGRRPEAGIGEPGGLRPPPPRSESLRPPPPRRPGDPPVLSMGATQHFDFSAAAGGGQFGPSTSHDPDDFAPSVGRASEAEQEQWEPDERQEPSLGALDEPEPSASPPRRNAPAGMSWAFKNSDSDRF
nr:flagellar biosynthetic protein FliO [Rhodoligotrophos appendicifer]